jgi:hypothetical protein
VSLEGFVNTTRTLQMLQLSRMNGRKIPLT